MSWSSLEFGKHEGKTIPQVVFSDPDWFFWAIQEDVFRNKGPIEEEDHVGVWRSQENLEYYPRQEFEQR